MREIRSLHTVGNGLRRSGFKDTSIVSERFDGYWPKYDRANLGDREARGWFMEMRNEMPEMFNR
jgi:hypothetical protein